MLLRTRLNVYDNSGAKTVQCIRKTKNRNKFDVLKSYYEI